MLCKCRCGRVINILNETTVWFESGRICHIAKPEYLHVQTSWSVMATLSFLSCCCTEQLHWEVLNTQHWTPTAVSEDSSWRLGILVPVWEKTTISNGWQDQYYHLCYYIVGFYYNKQFVVLIHDSTTIRFQKKGWKYLRIIMCTM